MPNYCYNKIVIRNLNDFQIEERKDDRYSRQVDYYSNDKSASNSRQVGYYQKGEINSWYEFKRLVKKGIPENSVMQMTCPIDGDITNRKCIKKWGTKWDFDTRGLGVNSNFDCEVEIEDDKITIQGQTAWEPPIEWLRHIQKKFDIEYVECYYHEDGMEFAGRYCGYDEVSINEGSGDDDNRFEWKRRMDDDALHYLYQEAESQETTEDEINTRFFDLIENHFRCKLRDEFYGDDLDEWEYNFFIDDYDIEMEMERYLDEIKPNMLSLPEKMERLEKLEDQLEKGEISEGVYLEECNKLK